MLHQGIQSMDLIDDEETSSVARRSKVAGASTNLFERFCETLHMHNPSDACRTLTALSYDSFWRAYCCAVQCKALLA